MAARLSILRVSYESNLNNFKSGTPRCRPNRRRRRETARCFLKKAASYNSSPCSDAAQADQERIVSSTVDLGRCSLSAAASSY